MSDQEPCPYCGEIIDVGVEYHDCPGRKVRRVLVCGSRYWRDPESIRRALHKFEHIEVVIHGACRGADRIAGLVAGELGIAVEEYPADWERLGPLAGPIRNQEMLDRGKPDLVLAFPLGESRGTRDMIFRARYAGVPVRVFEREDGGNDF